VGETLSEAAQDACGHWKRPTQHQRSTPQRATNTITPTYCNDHLWGPLWIYYCNAGVCLHHATSPFLIAFFAFKNPGTVSRMCRDLPFFRAPIAAKQPLASGLCLPGSVDSGGGLLAGCWLPGCTDSAAARGTCGTWHCGSLWQRRLSTSGLTVALTVALCLAAAATVVTQLLRVACSSTGVGPPRVC
jgi:hypothetical protein